MDPTTTAVLAEVIACRKIVEDYAQRIDDACVEYYNSGKTLFPNLSRAEDENVGQHCAVVISQVDPLMPDIAREWKDTKYPINQYTEQIERMRDLWIRRRNLLRRIETILKTRIDLESNTKNNNRNSPSTDALPANISPDTDIVIPETERMIMIELRQNILIAFDENELRDVCFERGIDYESLPGSGKSGKARELVSYCYRRGIMTDLISTCRKLRPNMTWPSTI